MKPVFHYLLSAIALIFATLFFMSTTRYNEYIIGYRYQQGYDTSYNTCQVVSDVGPKIECSTLYRLPYVLPDGEKCSWYDTGFCIPKFLNQSRVSVLVGYTTSDYDSYEDHYSKNPSSPRNHVDFSLLYDTYTYASRVFSSNDECNNLSPENSTRCLTEFTNRPFPLVFRHCFTPWYCPWEGVEEQPVYLSWLAFALVVFAIFILPNCMCIRSFLWLNDKINVCMENICACSNCNKLHRRQVPDVQEEFITN